MTYKDVKLEDDNVIIVYDYGTHKTKHRFNIYKLRSKVLSKLPEDIREEINNRRLRNPQNIVRKRQKGVISSEQYTLNDNMLHYFYLYNYNGKEVKRERTVNINNISRALAERLPIGIKNLINAQIHLNNPQDYFGYTEEGLLINENEQISELLSYHPREDSSENLESDF